MQHGFLKRTETQPNQEHKNPRTAVLILPYGDFLHEINLMYDKISRTKYR